MSMTRFGTVAAVSGIIGKDLDVGATFNADLDPAAGKQRAGRFMSYDATAKLLKLWDGIADPEGATIYGVLSDDVDTTENTSTVSMAAMVYREGTFRRQEIESANNASINPGSVLETTLRGLGINLELSYEGYVGISPVPAGVEPM
jgi:hypothetical protein